MKVEFIGVAVQSLAFQGLQLMFLLVLLAGKKEVLTEGTEVFIGYVTVKLTISRLMGMYNPTEMSDH